MTEQTANLLEGLAEREGLELQARHGYGARGGYGSPVSGVVVDGWGTLLRVVAAAAREAAEPEFERLVEDLGRVRSDSMGRDALIVY